MKTARLRVARLRQERVHRSRQVIHAAPRHRRHENQKRTADARRTARRTARRRVVSCRTRIGTSASGGALGNLAESEIFAPAAPRRAPRRRRRAPRDVHLLGGRYPLSAIQIALGFELGRARGGGARGGVSSRPRVPGDATRVAPGSGRRAALEPTHASVLDERPRDARRVLRARRATRLGGGGGRYGRSESIPGPGKSPRVGPRRPARARRRTSTRRRIGRRTRRMKSRTRSRAFWTPRIHRERRRRRRPRPSRRCPRGRCGAR